MKSLREILIYINNPRQREQSGSQRKQGQCWVSLPTPSLFRNNVNLGATAQLRKVPPVKLGLPILASEISCHSHYFVWDTGNF